MKALLKFDAEVAIFKLHIEVSSVSQNAQQRNCEDCEHVF